MAIMSPASPRGSGAEFSWDEHPPALTLTGELGKVEKKSLVNTMHKIWQKTTNVKSYFKLLSDQTGYQRNNVFIFQCHFHANFSSDCFLMGGGPQEKTLEKVKESLLLTPHSALAVMCKIPT